MMFFASKSRLESLYHYYNENGSRNDQGYHCYIRVGWVVDVSLSCMLCLVFFLKDCSSKFSQSLSSASAAIATSSVVPTEERIAIELHTHSQHQGCIPRLDLKLQCFLQSIDNFPIQQCFIALWQSLIFCW